MLNFASSVEYDQPLEVSAEEVNSYISCLPDGRIATSINSELSETISNYLQLKDVEIFYADSRDFIVRALLRILADRFMISSEPKFLMPYAIVMQNIAPELAKIFEHESDMFRLKRQYIPCTLRTTNLQPWNGGEAIKQYMCGNTIMIYLNLCTEYGWMIEPRILDPLLDACLQEAMPVILDITHIFNSGCIPTLKAPIVLGDFKYGFGPHGLAFVAIDKQFISGWEIADKLRAIFRLSPLKQFIANKSMINSAVCRAKDRTEIPRYYSILKQKFLDEVRGKLNIVPLFDMSYYTASPNHFGFYIRRGGDLIVSARLVQEKMMSDVLIGCVNARHGMLSENCRFVRLVEDDPNLEEVIVCVFTLETKPQDIEIMAKKLIKVIGDI